MPGKACDKIKDPKQKADCKAYKGKYAIKGRTSEEVQKMPIKTVKGIKYHVDEKGTPVASTKLSRSKTYVEKRQEYLKTTEGKAAIDRLIKKHKAHGGK